MIDMIDIDANQSNSVGVKSDGTAIAVGDNPHGQNWVSAWDDIRYIRSSGRHTVGLKNDGTVVAVGRNDEGQLNVATWTDIIEIAASWEHTVGLKSDGTIVTAGSDSNGADAWTGVSQIAAGSTVIAAIKPDGTALSNNILYDVSGWSDLIAIAAGDDWIVGLRDDNTCIAVGDNSHGQSNIGPWVLYIDIDPLEYVLHQVECIESYCRLWNTVDQECSIKVGEQIQKHIHNEHNHQLEHACEDGYATDCGLPAGSGLSGVVPKANALVAEFVGNEDLDDNGLVYGKDFKIDPTDSDMPPMLEPVDTHPGNTATVTMTWQEYLDSLI